MCSVVSSFSSGNCQRKKLGIIVGNFWILKEVSALLIIQLQNQQARKRNKAGLELPIHCCGIAELSNWPVPNVDWLWGREGREFVGWAKQNQTSKARKFQNSLSMLIYFPSLLKYSFKGRLFCLPIRSSLRAHSAKNMMHSSPSLRASIYCLISLLNNECNDHSLLKDVLDVDVLSNWSLSSLSKAR